MEGLKYVAFVTFCLFFMFVGSSGLQASDVLIESWVARYNGPGNGRDLARALAVDSAGNVYSQKFKSQVRGSYPGSNHPKNPWR